MATIVHHNEYKEPHFCTGTVISNEHILTAAHCVNETIAGHIQHPEYISEIDATGGVLKSENDIAVIKLATPLKFSKTVQPICLPSSLEEDTTSKEIAVIAGWGVREFPRDVPDVLLEGTESFKDFEECQEEIPVPPLKKKMHLCTQGTSTFTLRGDSGGPVFVKSGLTDEQGRPRWIEVGVTSLGSQSGKDVFARVSSYCGCIKNAIEGKVKCLF